MKFFVLCLDWGNIDSFRLVLVNRPGCLFVYFK